MQHRQNDGFMKKKMQLLQQNCKCVFSAWRVKHISVNDVITGMRQEKHLMKSTGT
jgi:hypothetical protein